MTQKDDALALVEATWQELGLRVRATGYKVWVRTFPHERKTASGNLWLPPKLQGFHGELPHLVTVRALVLSAGPVGVAREFEPGDVVEFQRLQFGFQWRVGDLVDQQYVGFLDANHILWKREGVEIPDGRRTENADGFAALNAG